MGLEASVQPLCPQKLPGLQTGGTSPLHVETNLENRCQTPSDFLFSTPRASGLRGRAPQGSPHPLTWAVRDLQAKGEEGSQAQGVMAGSMLRKRTCPHPESLRPRLLNHRS